MSMFDDVTKMLNRKFSEYTDLLEKKSNLEIELKEINRKMDVCNQEYKVLRDKQWDEIKPHAR